MTTITRRTCLKKIGLFASTAIFPTFFQPCPVIAQEAEPLLPTPSERAAMAEVARQFMNQYRVPGLSVAFGRYGRLVYAESFGLANKETGERVTPAHLFRIASATKPITSVAVYYLVERGQLRLDATVFGPRGLLAGAYDTAYKGFIEEITVHHLLTHIDAGIDQDTQVPVSESLRLGLQIIF